MSISQSRRTFAARSLLASSTAAGLGLLQLYAQSAEAQGAAASPSTFGYRPVQNAFRIDTATNQAIIQAGDQMLSVDAQNYIVQDNVLYVTDGIAQALSPYNVQFGSFPLAPASGAGVAAAGAATATGLNATTLAIIGGGAVIAGGIAYAVFSSTSEDTTAPTFSGSADISVDENSTGTLFTVSANDDKDSSPTYSLSGTDAARFSIGGTGAISLASGVTLDHENPVDDNGDNIYQVTVTAKDDAGNEASRNLTITVIDLDETAPTFNAGASTTGTAAENGTTTSITSFAVTDAEASTLTYSISGGDDSALFSIDSATGALTFISAPDLEGGASSNGDDVYEVTVTVADAGGNSDSISVAITVTNVDEDTYLSTTTTHTETVAESDDSWSYTNVATDPDGGTPTYALSGANATLFTVSSAGVVSWDGGTAPDFETVGAGPFSVVLTATDPTDLSTSAQTIQITLSDVDDAAPAFGGATVAASATENSTAVSVGASYTVTDADTTAANLVYSISGGVDSSLFDIDSATGALTFKSAPDFETPGDVGTDNGYDVQVTVTDAGGNSDSISVAITVTNVDEDTYLSTTTTHTETVAESDDSWSYTNVATDPDGGTPTYALSGTNATLFTVSSAGVVSWNGGTAPDFETVGAGPFSVVLTASDPTDLSTSAQTIQITLSDVDDAAPAFGGATVTASATENSTAVGVGANYTVTDADTTAANLVYSISGGVDSSLFDIDSATGALTFKSAPDFETPGDVGTDNGYDVQVTVTDAGMQTDVIDVTVNVADTLDVYSGVSAETMNIQAIWSGFESAIEAISGEDVQDGFDGFLVLNVHDVDNDGTTDADNDILLVFYDSDGTATTGGDASMLWLGFDNWATLGGGSTVTYANAYSSAFVNPSNGFGYFDETDTNTFRAETIGGSGTSFFNVLIDDFVDSSNDNTASGTYPGTYLNFYIGTASNGGYDEFFQLNGSGLITSDTNDSLTGSVLTTLVTFDQDHYYDLVDYDADGDLELFDYDPGTDTLQVYHQTSTSGSNQYSLLSGADNPFNGLSLHELANGGAGAATTNAVESFRFLNTDADSEMELLVASTASGFTYDLT